MTGMESRQQLESQLQKILKWEKEQKDVMFWEKLGRIPFMLLDRLTPKAVQEKIGSALNEVGGFIQSGGKHLVREQTVMNVLAKVAEGEGRDVDTNLSVTQSVQGDLEAPLENSLLTLTSAAKLPLHVMDTAADALTVKRVKFAEHRVRQQELVAYLRSRLICRWCSVNRLSCCRKWRCVTGMIRTIPGNGCLSSNACSSPLLISSVKKRCLRSWPNFDDEQATEQVFSQLQGWREVVQSYTDNFGMKKLFQLIPIAGIIFGSISNKGTISDVAEAGKMLYKKRRLQYRLRNMEYPL